METTSQGKIIQTENVKIEETSTLEWDIDLFEVTIS